MNQETSNQDILEVVQTLSTHIDEQFKHVDEQFEDVRAKMVTKEYLDEKLMDLRGDLVH